MVCSTIFPASSYDSCLFRDIWARNRETVAKDKMLGGMHASTRRASIQPLMNPMIKPPMKVVKSCMYFPTLTWEVSSLVFYIRPFSLCSRHKRPFTGIRHTFCFFCQSNNELLPSHRGRLGWVQCPRTFLKLLLQLSSPRQRMQCLASEQLQGITIAAVLTAFLQPPSSMTPLEQVNVSANRLGFC